ncbi:MAG: DUF4412 domain-containing protein [Chlorobi bacterium]|nr:DUF4412 domain-containing protein [Chlorobiota bacterium]
MRKRIIKNGLLIGITMTSLSVLSQSTGWKIEQITYDVSKDGIKSNQTKQTIYIGKEAVRIENKQGVTLFKIEGDSAYIVRLMPPQKTYMVLPSQFLIMGMLGTYFKCENTGCEIDTTAIQPTGETDTVKGYKTQKIKANMKIMGVQTTQVYQWMTKDWHELNEAMDAYWKVVKKVLLKNVQEPEQVQLMKNVFEYIEEIQDKYGNTIKSEMTLWGQTTVTETVSVSKVNLSPDMFIIPKDYQEMQGFMQFRK